MILTVGIVNDAQFSSIDNTLVIPIKRLTVPNYCTRRAPMAPIQVKLFKKTNLQINLPRNEL